METPNDREVAEFFLLGCGCGLTETADVVAWADDLIQKREKPAQWLLELSLSTGKAPHALVELLREVPGEAKPFLPIRMLLARMRDAFALGKASGSGLAHTLLTMAIDKVLPPEMETDAYVAHDRYELVAEGYCTKEEADAELREILARHAASNVFAPRGAA